MKRFSQLLFVIVPFLFLMFTACNDDDTIPPNTLQPAADITTCVGCHSDEATLKRVAEPNPPAEPGEGGCGGTLPEMEAWAKVYVGGDNGAKFLNSTHGKLACVNCHGGQEPAKDKIEAHSVDFVVSPSQNAEKYCGGCHPSIAIRDKHSIHTQGFGQKRMVADRAGLPSYENYPELLKKGYDENCGKCHSSCGECHVMRPRQAGGGFLASHDFQKKPDMRLNCAACHSARVAHAYFGEGFGLRPDVHYLKMPGGQCTNCHTGDEMHGTGHQFEQRYSVPNMPRCEQCHADKASVNSSHRMHWDDISCQVCHSQEYQNCGSCHVDTGVRNGPYMAFKIGRNPLPKARQYKWVVLRNAPHAPDTWSNYGIPNLNQFNTYPTWKMATPHNIQRTTPRNQNCTSSCHIKDGKNKEWYLFDEDLKTQWEKDANASVVVDGALPANWKY